MALDYADTDAAGIPPEQLAEWAKSGANIAAELDRNQLASIADRVLRDYEGDAASREGREKVWDAGLKLAKQVREVKQYPWPNAASVKFPAITSAVIQFAARSYPAIVSSTGVAKAREIGNDEGLPAMAPDGRALFRGQNGEEIPLGDEEFAAAQQDPDQARALATLTPIWEKEPGGKRRRADRVARHLNYQLLEEMEEWEQDTDVLMHMLPCYGCAFRKVWYNPQLRRNQSRLVSPEDLVIHVDSEGFGRAMRATEAITLYRSEVITRQRAGTFLDVPLNMHTGNDADPPIKFLEQHTVIDLDDDGYPEPYVVTVHVDTRQVVRITARFRPDGIEADEQGIVEIKPAQFYVMYTLIPNPDGSVYGLGFCDLIGSLNESVNSILNQSIDAGHLQTLGGGWISAGAVIEKGEQRMRPAEFKEVEVVDNDIRKTILQLPHPGPSPVLFQILGVLIEATQDVSSVKDILSGEMPQNQTATATMALIEQGLKVFTGIHKRIYRALKQELRLLMDLNREHVTPEDYAEALDERGVDPQADYVRDDKDVVPVADPTMLTEMQRVARAEVLMGFAADPYFNPVEIRRRYLLALGIDNIDDLLVTELPPDPKVALEADKIEVEKVKLQLEAEKLRLDAEGKQQELALKAEEGDVNAAEKLTRAALNLAQAEAAVKGADADEMLAKAKKAGEGA